MFNLIQSFIAVYETKSFTKAANQLFISQPTVTTHIKKLEAELKAPLFVRQGKQVIPTAVADAFYPEAHEFRQSWLNTKRNLNQLANQKINVTIGASHSAATTLLPQFIQLLEPYLDRIALSVRMLNSEQVSLGILNHELQIGIIEKPLLDPNMTSFPLADDKLVHAGDFTSPIWLIRETGSGIYHFTHEYLEMHQIHPQRAIEMDNNDMILACLKRGFGQSLISSRFIDDSFPYEDLGPEFNREFYVLNHINERDPLLLEMLQHVKQHVDEFS
ncbi:DNA-binding transcriptional LysR family regulator [Weissella uvarum]|uniref:LysR family transcriptional regulator n=1 Tax=Weissella uvarum TaxID=1479233 RepID=UPI001961126E|nr:LysR family transcriptional regulator [Weissella uvarum]MBM7616710.1 DNA-binding transcriptional LysR family regulator [Weissella uvarum]MCM0594835.1 LysR family transcriptional regulator [Weissella uvarum]